MSFLRLAVNTSLYAYHPLRHHDANFVCSLCPLWLNSKI